MRKCILILLSIASISCKQETVKPKNEIKELISEELTYEVINSIFEKKSESEKDDRSITKYVACENTFFSEPGGKDDDYIGISKMDTLFSKKDVKFILEQKKASVNFSLKQSLLKYKILIPNDTLTKFGMEINEVRDFWGNFIKKYGHGGFYTISKPLFTLDKKTVIVSTGFHCGGLCGGGSTFILKKIKGKWKFVAELESWAS